MLSSVVVSLALAASALANVFLTAPTSSSTLTAGQSFKVSWTDDGTSPSSTQFGNATFAIYVGNALQQTPLQTIATYIDVGAVSSVTFTPDATIGPDSNEYFVRVTSQTYKASQYYAEAFSAKFSMTGMSGSFNSSVQAEINGQSTAPIGQPTMSGSPASGTMGAGPIATTTPSSASASVPPATTSASSKSSTNGAGKPMFATSLVTFAAALVGASFF